MKWIHKISVKTRVLAYSLSNFFPGDTPDPITRGGEPLPRPLPTTPSAIPESDTGPSRYIFLDNPLDMLLKQAVAYYINNGSSVFCTTKAFDGVKLLLRTELGRAGRSSQPVLLSLYIDELLQLFSASKIGCYSWDISVGILIYADGIVLLDPSAMTMRALL